MRPSLISDVLKARFKAGIHRPMYLIGAPGLGKTQIIGQVARELGIGFRALHAPLMQPEDMGMPVVNATRDGIKFVVPTEKFPVEGADCEEMGILLIDELPQADASIQKTLANLMQEREIHGQYLKAGWMIVATGNRASDRAGASRVLTHLMNRMTTYEFDVHLDDWCNWYMAQPDCCVEGISFMRWRPSMLLDFNPQRDINPTPRAWVEGVFASIGQIPVEAEFETFKGDVGEGAAAEFLAFLKIYRELPDVEQLLKEPDKAKVPTESSVLFALSGALAQAATVKNFEAVMKFAARIPPEYVTIIVRDTMRRDPAIQRTPAFLKWVQGPGAKLLH